MRSVYETAASLEEFVRIALKYSSTDAALIELSRACSHYKSMITRANHRRFLEIKMTHVGVKGTFIRVVPNNTGDSKYIEIRKFSDSTKVDVAYYTMAIKTSLESVTTAMGLADCDSVFAGSLLGNRDRRQVVSQHH